MKSRWERIWIPSLAACLLSITVLAGCNARSASPTTTQTAGSQPASASATAAEPTAPATIEAPASSTPVPPTVTPEATAGSTAGSTATSEPVASPTASQAATSTATSENTETAAAATETATETAAATASPETLASPAEACTDIAAFFKDVSVEDYTFFNQNEKFVKTWQVRNAGTCTWGPGYTIFFDSGFTFDAPELSPLPAAAPGQIVDISLDMTAPNRGGQYMSRWRFKNPDGKIFGVGLDNGQLYTIINIGFVNPNSPATQPAGGPASTTPQATAAPGASSGTSSCNVSLDPSFAQQLVAIINQARQQAGLNTLNVQSQLTAAAQEHSLDIACHDSYDHIGSDGSVWTDRVARQGYANYTSARENIRVGDPAFGFSPQYVFDRWFESQIHHDNMYYPSVSDIGIACALNPDSEYKEFCTAVFARP